MLDARTSLQRQGAAAASWPVGRALAATGQRPASAAAAATARAARRRARGVAHASPRDSDNTTPDEPLANSRSWLSTAPRIRVRGAQQRAASEILELAAVNERLAGELEPWEVRRRLEHLRARVEDWEAVYSYVTARDAAATLAVVEEAAAAADALLGAGRARAAASAAASVSSSAAGAAAAEDEAGEQQQQNMGVAELRAQLLQLRAQVDEAASRLSATQDRVDENLRRVGELRAEAARLEALRASDARAEADVARRRAEMRSEGGGGGSPASSSSSSSSSAAVAAEAAEAAARAAERVAREQAAVDRAADRGSSGAGVVAPVAAAASPSPPTARGLASSLDLERGLRNFWYAAAFSSRLDAKTLIPFELFGEPWVLFRGADGQASCLRDECAHRACPLSLGRVEAGAVSCAYHGWKFAGDGACVDMPSTRFCRGVSVRSLPVVEANGFVWVWPGDKAAPVVGDGAPEWQSVAAAALPPPTTDTHSDGSTTTRPYLLHAEIELEVPVEHGLLMENLLDLAHAPFTHTSTFAKGWPVPEAVRFHAERALAGAWDPYPIDMAFAPPCVAVSTIGLAQPGKIRRGVRAEECARHLHQLHVCLPARKGHTRLLYRMALDFMPWARGLPLADKLWESVARQVLGEDLVLVQGQQARMTQGGDTWQNPVSYDKLAVRYRRWRNAAAAAGATAAGAAGVAPGSRRAAERLSAPVTMSAGELFLDEEDGGVMVVEQSREEDEEARAAADDEGVYVDGGPSSDDEEATAVAAAAQAGVAVRR
jgi:chlorophyllide a oxygenase